MPWGSLTRGQALPPFGLPPWRAPLWPTASTPPMVRQSYVKIGYVCFLDYFAFLTCSFTCLSGWLRITTRRRDGRWLHQHRLEPGGRIRRQLWRQWHGAIVLVSIVLGIVLSCWTIVLSSRPYCFSFYGHELECLAVMYTFLYSLSVLEAPHPGRCWRFLDTE
jgi:hypothetical protein